MKKTSLTGLAFAAAAVGALVLTACEDPLRRVPAIVATITITPEEAEIDVGETVDLEAASFDGAGNFIFMDEDFTWTSEDENIATVEPTSVSTATVTGVAEGVVDITAAKRGTEETATITVVQP